MSELEAVSASSPPEQTPARYERLLAKLTDAEQELDEAGALGPNGHLEEASAIIFDLLYSLDFRQGGELVPRLAALYGYIASQLLLIGKTKNRSDLTHVSDIVRSLKQSWYGNAA